MRRLWVQAPAMQTSWVQASVSDPHAVPSVTGPQALPVSTWQGGHAVQRPSMQSPLVHPPHMKQPEGDGPHCWVPQSLGGMSCTQRATVPSLLHESTVQALWSSQSAGALRTQRSDVASQLQTPWQGSWLRRWQGVSPASQEGGRMHPAAVSQNRPAGHIASSGWCVHAPRAASQASSVQASPSSQLAAVPRGTHTPDRHSRAAAQKPPP
jgi:hypothetical protein